MGDPAFSSLLASFFWTSFSLSVNTCLSLTSMRNCLLRYANFFVPCMCALKFICSRRHRNIPRGTARPSANAGCTFTNDCSGNIGICVEQSQTYILRFWTNQRSCSNHVSQSEKTRWQTCGAVVNPALTSAGLLAPTKKKKRQKALL